MKLVSNRRTFLKSLVFAGSGLAAMGGTGPFARLARGAEADQRFYVFCYFSGGWDVLLGLDPRDPAVFTGAAMRNTRIQPGYELLPVGFRDVVRVGGRSFGPYIGELASPDLLPQLAVVRGMSMDTLTHEVGMRRFLTGKPPSGLNARGSSTATWIASRLGAQEPIPNLSVQVESYNDDQPTYATGIRVNSMGDLLRALRPAAPLQDAMSVRQVNQLLEEEAACQRSLASDFLTRAESSRKKADDMVGRQLDQLFDFLPTAAAQDTTIKQEVRAAFGFPPEPWNTAGFNRDAALASSNARAATAALAIMNGVSRCVSIRVASGLDTHFQEWAQVQGPRQMEGFNAMARLARFLATREFGSTGESYLSRTTVLGFSEFSRTPLLNGTTGRDHALANSCVLLGGRVRGGDYGASSDVGMGPQAVSLDTGRADPGGEIIRPDHVLRTLMVDAGISADEADLRVGPLTAMTRA